MAEEIDEVPVEKNEESELDEDNLSPEEQGFLQGYEEEAESEQDFGLDSEPEDAE